MFRLKRPMNVWEGRGVEEVGKTAAEDKEREMVPVEDCIERADNRFNEGE